MNPWNNLTLEPETLYKLSQVVPVKGHFWFKESTMFKMQICLIPFDDETVIQDIPRGNHSLGTLSASLPMLCFPIAAMETKKSSLAGESSWLWTGSGTEDIPTSKCSFPPGGKNHQELTPPLEVCWSRVVLRRFYAPFSVVLLTVTDGWL